MQASGYLELDIQRFEQLSDAKYVDISGLKIRKHNKTRKVYGNVTMHFDWAGNEVLGEIRAFKKSGGEYRLLPYKLPRTPVCKALNEDIYFYPEMTEMSSFPKKPISCPQPKVNICSEMIAHSKLFSQGIYEFNGYHMEGKNMPIMIMPSGDYAIEVTWWKEDVVLFRFRGYSFVINI